MDRTHSQSFARGLKVLADLNQFNGATVREVAERTQIQRVVVDRLLRTLVSERLVVREGRPARHFLLGSVQGLSHGYHPETWVNHVARPLVTELGRTILWPVSLAVNDGLRMRMCLLTDPESPLTRRKIPVGFEKPLLKSAAGLTYLAFVDARTRDALLSVALADDARGREMRQIKALVGKTRERGYALWYSPERVTTLAVPVLVRRRPRAALATRYFSASLSAARAIKTLLPLLRACANQLGEKLAEQ